MMEQQQATHQQATAELQERILRNEAAAAAAVAAARDVIQANAVTMANALAAAGIGLAPAPRNPKNDNSKSFAKMPIFKKEEGKDFLIFKQKFRAYALLQKLNDANKKLNLFMALEANGRSGLYGNTACGGNIHMLGRSNYCCEICSSFFIIQRCFYTTVTILYSTR